MLKLNDKDMFILDVVLLTATPRSQDQILSYFCEENLPIGSLVEVGIRKRKVKAIVLASKELAKLKIRLKKEADFELKPILKVIQGMPLVNGKRLNLALWLSAKYFAPLGLCIKAVLPPFWDKKRYRITLPMLNLVAPQKLVLIPEKIMARYFLEKYSAESPVFISSGTPNKEYFGIWQKVSNGEIIAIVGTRVALFIPFLNLKEIVVEDESNIAYRSDYTPKYDTGVLARRTAKEYGVRLTINDSLPKVETYFEFGEKMLPKKINANISFADMVGEIKNANFSIFSAELKEQLESATKQKNKIIIFVPRKGYAPYLLCQNCGYTHRCPKCEHVLVVHKIAASLKCHHCQNIQPTLNVCPNCNKSVLEYKGLGIEKAEEKLIKFFKDRNVTPPKILALSGDTTPKEEENVLNQFRDSSPAILLATQKILNYKHLLKADLVGILNLESLLNFVNFRTEEEALRTVFILSQMAEKTIIQGYDPETRVVKTILSQDFKGFYKEELEARKDFNYPPFAELVKLTFRHRDQKQSEGEAKIILARLNQEAKIKNYTKEVEILGPNPRLREKGLYTQEIILKSKLEIKKRNELLRLLNSGWQVEIN